VNAIGCVCLMLGQQQMKGEVCGYKYPSPKLVVTVLKPAVICTIDVRSVLPRVTENCDKQGLLVVPAWGWNYRRWRKL
jgi:hypothetical protein